MIKPLLTLTCTSEGAGSHSASDSDFNSGKAAYEQLLHKEDLHYVSRPDTAKLEVIAPYHAIESAVVTRSSETVEDPVDSLCKSENDGPELCDDIVLVPAASSEYVEDGYTAADFQENLTISGNTITGTLKCSPLGEDAPPFFVLNETGTVIPEGYDDIYFFADAIYDFEHTMWFIDNLNTRAIPAINEQLEPITAMGAAFAHWEGDELIAVSDCRSYYNLNLTIEECGG